MLPNWLYGKSLRKLQEILNSGGQTAEDVSYSNTESGLEATNAQAAIDEVVEESKIETASLTGDLSFNSNEIAKKNGIVTINAIFQADKDYSGFTRFASIPSEFRPITNHPIGSLFNDTQKTIISTTAYSSGAIQASTNIKSGEHYRLVMTYIIA